MYMSRPDNTITTESRLTKSNMVMSIASFEDISAKILRIVTMWNREDGVGINIEPLSILFEVSKFH